ncbi:MAG: Ltp family lipoprotein, partial [Anaerovoracaceae bacterium]
VLALVIFILMIVTVIWTFAVNSDGYYKSSESILYDENSKKLEAEFELIGKDELLDTLREYTGLEDLDFDYSLTSSVDVVHCEIKKFKSDKIDDYYTVEINDEKAEKLKDILEYLADMRDNEEHDDYDDYDFTFTGSAGTNIGIDIWGSYDSIETSSGRIYELRSGEVYINNKVVYENKNSAVSTETTPTKTAVPEVTMGEINALQSAKDYLEYSGFSYKGLIEQLEYEGYSNKEATYAADNCGADWKKEAIRVAQDYIDYTSFSKQGLIEQLKYEGFTSEQAAYGASGVGY